MDDSIPIEHSLVSRSIENAQKRVENKNFDIRKHVLNMTMFSTSREKLFTARGDRCLRVKPQGQYN